MLALSRVDRSFWRNRSGSAAPARCTVLTFQSRSNNPSESPAVTSATIWPLIGPSMFYQLSSLLTSLPITLSSSRPPCCYPSFVPSPSSSDGTNFISVSKIIISKLINRMGIVIINHFRVFFWYQYIDNFYKYHLLNICRIYRIYHYLFSLLIYFSSPFLFYLFSTRFISPTSSFLVASSLFLIRYTSIYLSPFEFSLSVSHGVSLILSTNCKAIPSVGIHIPNL